MVVQPSHPDVDQHRIAFDNVDARFSQIILGIITNYLYLEICNSEVHVSNRSFLLGCHRPLLEDVAMVY